MSYYRSPDDLPGPEADAAVVSEPVAAGAPASAGSEAPGDQGWPAPPASIGGAAMTPAPISIAAVAEAAAAEEARRKRKRALIIGCVAVDAIIVVIVLAIFVL